jgi:hypothetical protein
MISKTYVNEIDISKVRPSQQVEIGVDAFPEKKFSGIVKEVANIGQQLPNSNAKVFEVVIEVNEYDSILRPAMTTKNQIITDIVDSVLFLPLECIHANDSISYVFADGEKRQIITGNSNENEIIIKYGLKEGDMVYLTPPENVEEYKLEMLDKEILDRIKAEEEAQKAAADSIMKARRQQNESMMKEFSPEQMEKFRKGGPRQGMRKN